MQRCTNCGNLFEGRFCDRCGKEFVPPVYYYCANCGNAMGPVERFCPKCGTPRQNLAQSGQPYVGGMPRDDGNIKDKVKKRLYDIAGENDDVKIKLSDLFSDIFKKHNNAESENIFIGGTSRTTPALSDINTEWPRPWVYSRVFLVLFLSSLLMYLCFEIFGNTNALPGLIILGSFTGPITCLFFFFEINAPRDISFYRMLKYFLVGGCASLLFTLVLYSFFDIGELTYGAAIIVSIVEELGKMAITAFIISRVRPKFRLSGIVIGASVGAGFAALESAGYAFNWLLSEGFESMMHVIYLRGLLSPGGHVVWAAISGYAIMLAMGDKPFTFSVIISPKFLKLFAISFALHAVWDMPIGFLAEIYGVQILLTIASWCVMLVLVSAGLKQVNNIIKEDRESAFNFRND